MFNKNGYISMSIVDGVSSASMGRSESSHLWLSRSYAIFISVNWEGASFLCLLCPSHSNAYCYYYNCTPEREREWEWHKLRRFLFSTIVEEAHSAKSVCSEAEISKSEMLFRLFSFFFASLSFFFFASHSRSSFVLLLIKLRFQGLNVTKWIKNKHLFWGIIPHFVPPSPRTWLLRAYLMARTKELHHVFQLFIVTKLSDDAKDNTKMGIENAPHFHQRHDQRAALYSVHTQSMQKCPRQKHMNGRCVISASFSIHTWIVRK